MEDAHSTGLLRDYRGREIAAAERLGTARVHGNLAEWTADKYSPDGYAGRGTLTLDPHVPNFAAAWRRLVHKYAPQTESTDTPPLANRDRRKPRGSPLPHHSAYGSVPGGSSCRLKTAP